MKEKPLARLSIAGRKAIGSGQFLELDAHQRRRLTRPQQCWQKAAKPVKIRRILAWG
jgi:hypothetical protein